MAFSPGSRPGGYDPRSDTTSNAFLVNSQAQLPIPAATASLRPNQAGHTRASLRWDCTPLTSPPLSMIGQAESEIDTTCPVNLRYYPATSGTVPSQHLPAGTWATDISGHQFAVNAVGLSSHQSTPQVFQSAPQVPELSHIYHGSYPNHQQLPAALQHGARPSFYNWPTPLEENAHRLSWCTGSSNNQAQDFQFPARLSVQSNVAPGGDSFGRCSGGAQPDGSLPCLFASNTSLPVPLEVRLAGERLQYGMHGVHCGERHLLGSMHSSTQERLASNGFQPRQMSTLNLADRIPQTSQPPNVRHSRHPGCDSPSSCGTIYPSSSQRPKLTTTFWKEEQTTCYQIDAQGACVARRKDNNMVNGTKLLNVVGLSRGKRDALLKGEKVRHVVRSGPMPLKGVWIPLSRAIALSAQFGIDARMHPLFEDEPSMYLCRPGHFAGHVADSPPVPVPSRQSPSKTASASMMAAQPDQNAPAPFWPVSPSPSFQGVMPAPEEYREFIIPS